MFTNMTYVLAINACMLRDIQTISPYQLPIHCPLTFGSLFSRSKVIRDFHLAGISHMGRILGGVLRNMTAKISRCINFTRKRHIHSSANSYRLVMHQVRYCDNRLDVGLNQKKADKNRKTQVKSIYFAFAIGTPLSNGL
jgi:hypothetical protein